ncbi:MAG: AAC(3) family N-acetyltransferase [Armatimonadetes bacterium]|nr:AAC(3) family N-acetyltransferase [Armatimonadota bacterium]
MTKQHIIRGITELGLKAGDAVLVHASLSSFGKVSGGAAAVVDAILDVLGPEGTLVVPTFSFGSGVFDPKDTPSLVGAVSEEVRKRSNAVRSLHPTHSVAAIGALAEAITEGHEKTHPFGRGSALFKALQANSKILQLGTTQTSNSMIHVAEELANLPYLERTRKIEIKTPQDKVVRKWVRRPGCSRGFMAIEEILREHNAIRETLIGKCAARLMSARAVVNAAEEALKFDQEALLCDLPDCESCAEARAIISATAADKQDREITELVEHEERMRHLIETTLDNGHVTYFDPGTEGPSPN